MSEKEPVESRESADNVSQEDVTNVEGGIDLSLYDIDVSEPFGYGTGQDDPSRLDRTFNEEGLAISTNPIGPGQGDQRVKDLQILMISELDPEGRKDQPSTVLKDYGVDGVWRCETQAAFNSLLDKKGIQNKTVGQGRDSKCPDVEQFELTEETLEELRRKAAEEEESGPSAEDVKIQRNTFEDINDQCILMSNLEQIINESRPPEELDIASSIGDTRESIKYTKIHKVDTKDPGTLLNKLRMRKGVLQFLSIRHWQLSQLVPTIKIYKQYNQGPGRPPREVEIKFNSFVDPITDLQDMLNSREQRGIGVGIEYLSYSLYGSNPDTAKTQVNGKLAIYAQNFNELFKVRRGFDQDGVEFEGGYRIIDLLLQSLGGAGRINDPNNYSLKIVAGWGATGGGGLLEPVLVNTLKEMQLTMVVTVGSYQIDVLEDQGGAVRVILNFYPRLEAVSLTRDSDVLADEVTRDKRKKRKEVFNELIESKGVVDVENPDGESKSCLSAEEIKKLKSIYDADVLKDIENSQGSLLRALLTSGLIYSAVVRQKTDDEIREEMEAIAESDTQLLEDEERLANELAKRPKVEVVSDYCNDENYQAQGDINKDPESRVIQYFFLGDLLSIALNNVLDSKSNEIYFGNVRYITGPVVIEDPDGVGETKINIADIPISVDLFADFMASKMPRRIETGTTYPLQLFTREVIKDLVFEAMGQECFLGTNRKNVVLETDIITADSNDMNTDPLESKYNIEKPKDRRSKDEKADTTEPTSVLDLDQFRIDFDNPDNSTFAFDSFNSKSFKDKYTYLVIYAKTNRPANLGPPDPPLTRMRRDFENGIFHLTNGLDRGLLKTVSFAQNGNVSKLLAAGRMQENRNLPDLQLANNFEISADLFGNNLFFPGTYVYLNSRGLGSDLLGDPGDRVTPSPANILGIGGYHLISKVDCMINSNGFSTKLSAILSDSGSGAIVTPPELTTSKCPDDVGKNAEEKLKAVLINNTEGS